jgi:hypothetical protein
MLADLFALLWLIARLVASPHPSFCCSISYHSLIAWTVASSLQEMGFWSVRSRESGCEYWKGFYAE